MAKDYKPTWLYVKKHAITGIRYFGKTTRNPDTYLGSGVYWRRHIRKHGTEHVMTIWKHLFSSREDIEEFAKFFSEEFNVVRDNSWANLTIENGLDGGFTVAGKDHPFTGRAKELHPNFGKSGIKSPVFGKPGALLGKMGNLHPRFGKIGPWRGKSGKSHPRFGLSGENNAISKPVSINGKVYASMNIAAIELNMNRATLGSRCRGNSPNFTEWFIIG